MQTLNQSLAELYRARQITLETAMAISSNVEELKDLVGRRDAAGSAFTERLREPAITSSRRMSVAPRGDLREG
jgi:Tfp pilus assembly ATPase PilU